MLMAGLTAYAYLQLTRPGQLIVQAKALDRHPGAGQRYVDLSVQATVEGISRTTPFTLTLSPGTYTVSFSPLPWYRVLNPQLTISLPAGTTAYATGLYEPVPVVIAVKEGAFNVTKVRALHGVTPVIWVNQGANYTVLHIQPYGRVVLYPGQNFTWVYDEPGTYSFYLLFLPSVEGSVQAL